MSDVEEAMDRSVSGDEAEQEESPAKQSSSPEKSYMWGAGEIIEGKRVKKTVERLDIQAPKKADKLSIGEGSGEKLGDIPRIGFQLNKMKPDVLVPLHSLLFDRRGKLSMVKKNIRLFNGFSFDADSEQFTKKRDKLQKNTKSKLLVMCGVLDLEKKGSHSDLVEKIMAFLMSPQSSGKRLPMPKKKKRSKKNLSGEDGKSKKKPSKKRSSSSSKQKPSSTSSPKKSKAIVMDSSSDEDEDEEEEKAESEEAGAGSEAGSGEESGGQSGDEPQSEVPSDEEEEESPKPKARGKAKKTPPAKKQKTPSKKPAKKRSRKEVTDSESESSQEEEPKKKKSKPAAKTKKADSSSNSKTNNTTVDDSSDEDEPLSKMVKKSPSDEQLKETVKRLLKEADLEELTMKQICQKVFDAYSEHDLSSKKDFIKQTVKSLIT